MKVLFILCEGNHDAFFLNRLLLASEQFSEYEKPLKEFPPPLNQFLQRRFQEQPVDTIVIGGSPRQSAFPATAMISKEGEILVLMCPLGGAEQYKTGTTFVEDINKIMSPKLLDHYIRGIEDYAFSFFFDADDKGRSSVLQCFKKNYDSAFKQSLDDLELEKWLRTNGHPLSLFVFTGADRDTGTLEDLLLELFEKQRDGKPLENAQSYLDTFSRYPTDPVANQAKRHKAALTICGQTEKKCVGSSLAVILKKSTFLDNSFEFTDSTKPWSRILNLVQQAFL